MSSSDELKEILVAYVHAERISTYKDVYQKNNGGKSPTKKQLNDFVAILVAQGDVEKHAEQLKADLFKKVRQEAKGKNLLANTSIGLPICALLGILLVILIIGEMPPELLKTGYRFPAIIGCVTFSCVILISLVISATKKDK